MTSKDTDEEVRRQVALQIRILEPITTQIAVTQAVLAALVADHHNPSLLRQRAESLLMQAQAGLASSGKAIPDDGQFPRLLPDSMKTALDYLFRPAVDIDP